MSYEFTVPDCPNQPQGIAHRRKVIKTQAMAEIDIYRLGGTHQLFTAHNLAKPAALRRVLLDLEFFNGQASGIDHVRYTDINMPEICESCRVLSQQLEMGQYRPRPARLVKRPKASGIGFRTLKIPCILDRVAGKRFKELLETYYELVFLNSSYGFRPRIGREEMLIAMLRHMQEQRAYHVIHDDVRNAFDCVPTEVLLQLLAPLISDSRFLRTLESMIRAHSPAGTSRGIAQGCPLSPLLLNILFHHILDVPLYETTNTHGRHFRYVDNLVTVCPGEEQASRYRLEVSSRLYSLGMAIRGTDAVDVRICPTTVLGVQVRMENGYPLLTIPQSSLAQLNRKLTEALEKPNHRARIAATVNSWFQQHGCTHASYRPQERRVVCQAVANTIADIGLTEAPMHTMHMEQAWELGHRRWSRKWADACKSANPAIPFNNRSQSWTATTRVTREAAGQGAPF